MGRAMWFCSLVLVATIFAVVTADDSQEQQTTGATTTTEVADCIGCEQEIPIDLGNEINQFDTYADFVRNMIDLDTVDQRDQVFLLGNGTVDDSTLYERSTAIRPKPAACIPDVAIVSLRPETDTDPTMVYFPSCTRVKQCGGCCSHKLLSCQPTEVQQHAFEVVKSQYTGGTKMQLRGKEVMIIEEHTKCKCDCRIKEQDCNRFQRYDKSQCKCYCQNVDEQHKCLQDRSIKIWDASSCVCRCRENKDCQTGQHFNQNVCECISSGATTTTSAPSTIPTRSADERRKFIVTPVLINPDDKSVYDSS